MPHLQLAIATPLQQIVVVEKSVFLHMFNKIQLISNLSCNKNDTIFQQSVGHFLITQNALSTWSSKTGALMSSCMPLFRERILEKSFGFLEKSRALNMTILFGLVIPFCRILPKEIN